MRPTSSRLLWLPAFAPLIGCFTPRHETALILRDAHDVSVGVGSPTGERMVLGAGREATEVEIPRTMPPYAADELKQSFVLRDEVGSLMLRCDTCARSSATVLVPSDGVVRFPDTSGRVIGRDANGVAWTSVQRSWVALGRGGAWDDIVAVHLSTPLTNVASIHERNVLSRGAGVAELIVGLALAGVSGIAMGLAASKLDPGGTQTAVLTTGAIGGSLGLVITSSGLYYLLAPENDRVVYPRP